MTELQFELLREYMERIITELGELNKKLDSIENWTDINGNLPVAQRG